MTPETRIRRHASPLADVSSEDAFSFHYDALDAIPGQQSGDRETGNSTSNDNDWSIHQFGNLSSAQEFSFGISAYVKSTNAWFNGLDSFVNALPGMNEQAADWVAL